MESLPVEVIGNILSHVGAARDVIVASLTCRKWRDASRSHVSTLSFHVDESPAFRDFSSSRLEILITKSIFQTTGLQHLSIAMDELVSFSASAVLAWLLYSRETLKSLSFKVRVTPHVSILDLCGLHRLETLTFAHNSILGSAHLRLPCLRSVSLADVTTSEAELRRLLAACPRLESLELVSPQISRRASLELISPSLKRILLEGFSLEKLLLAGDSLEIVKVKELTMDVFELSGRESLKRLQLDDVSVMHLELGGSLEVLEVVEVSNFAFPWGKFLEMISRSSRMKRLKLWGVVFEDEEDGVEVEAIAVCFPELREMCLSFEVREGLSGDWVLGRLTVLEVGWSVNSEGFSRWVDGLMGRCPELRQLVVHGAVSEVRSHEDCQVLAEFMSFVVILMRTYLQVEVRFEFD
ncbi:F-box/LRR-repeat protein At1g67190-like [Wolffia australiana]